MNSASSVPDPGPAPARRRRLPWILLAVVLALLAVAAAAPLLISTAPVRNALLGWYNQSVAGALRVDQLSLSWFGGQAAHGVVIHDAQGQAIVTLDEFSTELTLLDALRGRLPLGSTVVRGLAMDLRFSADGRSNLAKALGGDAGTTGQESGAPVLPVTGNMRLVDSRISIAAPGIDPISLTQLSGEIVTRGADAPIELSFSGQSRQGEMQGSIALDGRIENLTRDGEIDAGAASATVNARIEDLPVDALDRLLGYQGQLSQTLGERLSMTLRADGDAARQNLSIHASTPRAELTLEGRIVEHRFQLQKPASARLTVTPEVVDAVSRRSGDAVLARLATALPLTLTVDRLTLPLTDFSPAAIAFEARLATEAPLQLSGIPSLGELRVDAPLLRVSSPGAGERIDVSLSGQPRTAAGRGDLSLDARVSGLFDEAGSLTPGRAAVEASAALGGLPVALVDAALEQDGLLTTALGETLDLSLDARRNAPGQIALTAAIDTARLKTGPVSLAVGEAISLTEPASFRATLTPALLAAWQHGSAPAVRLEQGVDLTGTLKTLHVPLSPFALSGLQVAGALATVDGASGSIHLLAPSGRSTRIDDPRTTFEFSGDERGHGRLEASGRIRSQGQDRGELALQASFDSLLDADGHPAPGAMSLDIEGGMQQLPVALLDQLLADGGMLSATLGSTADLQFDARLDGLRGPLSLTLKAQHASADIQARLDPQGLSLREPLQAEIEATPELGSQVLSSIHPILETIDRAAAPIRLEIPAEGVRIPLDPFSFERVTVPRMTLDLGQVVMKNGWLLRGIVELGQRFGKLEHTQKDELPAWFTPAVLEIRDGRVLYSRRLDLLLAERLHLATWGHADVSANQSRLVLAFMPETMRRVFGIEVAGEDALRVPINGPLSDPGIDFKSAAADLARLRAQEEVAGENPLAGALLGAVTGKPDRAGGGGPMPPASLDPLPWAGLFESRGGPAPTASDAATPAAPPPGGEPAPSPAPAPEKPPSTEEKVIRGLIDIFGDKKKKDQ